MTAVSDLLAPPNRLAELRAARRTQEGGWTQTQTAAAAGISPNRYWRIENREARPTGAELERLAALFGVSSSDIIPSINKEVA